MRRNQAHRLQAFFAVYMFRSTCSVVVEYMCWAASILQVSHSASSFVDFSRLHRQYKFLRHGICLSFYLPFYNVS